jgi:hypothetical protein
LQENLAEYFGKQLPDLVDEQTYYKSTGNIDLNSPDNSHLKYEPRKILLGNYAMYLKIIDGNYKMNSFLEWDPIEVQEKYRLGIEWLNNVMK